MSNHIDMMKRQTRNHTGLEWESNNLNSQFTDINRVALDDNYGKVAAPLSKRQNGTGPADRTAQPGLFGSSINGVFPDWFYTKEYRMGVWLGFGMGLATYYLYSKYG